MIATSAQGKGYDSVKRPVSLFLRPEKVLASCIYGAFIRDTRGCDLIGNDRMNHFAASPLCAISWCFEGRYALIRSVKDQSLQKEDLPTISFSGPQTGPRTSINESELYSMTIAFYPDAFQKLTKVKTSSFLDQTIPAKDVLSTDVYSVVNDIFVLGKAEEGFQLLCSFLKPLWQERRKPDNRIINSISDWTHAVLEQAPKSGFGKSIRQIERRIKNWTGHSKRDLEFYARVERSFWLANQHAKSGEVAPAEVAVAAGYSDQSHMGRNVKRLTGHSPRDLLSRIENEEAFWSYRLIAGLEKSVKDCR